VRKTSARRARKACVLSVSALRRRAGSGFQRASHPRLPDSGRETVRLVYLCSIHPRFLRWRYSRGATRGNECHASPLSGETAGGQGSRWYSLWNLVLRMDKIWCSLWRLSFVAFSCLSRARACSLISMSAEQHTSPPLFTPPHIFSSLAANETYMRINSEFRNFGIADRFEDNVSKVIRESAFRTRGFPRLFPRSSSLQGGNRRKGKQRERERERGVTLRLQSPCARPRIPRKCNIVFENPRDNGTRHKAPAVLRTRARRALFPRPFRVRPCARRTRLHQRVSSPKLSAEITALHYKRLLFAASVTILPSPKRCA